MKQWLMVAAVVALCGMMTGCKGNAQRPVNGTFEGLIGKGTPPEAVLDATKKLTVTDERLETVMEDKASGVAVCMPRARYDATTGDLWIVGSDIEGTGINVERPYLLRFDADGHAEIAGEIDPYEIQQALCKALTYSIDGQEITFYAEGKELAKATNTMKDMGGFMDDAIYIGEQIAYGIEGPLTVHVTPGVNFVVGKVLHYDDMPTISATVIRTDDGNFKLSDFKANN